MDRSTKQQDILLNHNQLKRNFPPTRHKPVRGNVEFFKEQCSGLFPALLPPFRILDSLAHLLFAGSLVDSHGHVVERAVLTFDE